MAAAPVCNLSQDQVINQPPIKQLPSIPPVDPTNLDSMAAAIAAMTQILNAMTGQQAQSGGAGSQGAAANAKKKLGRWEEVSRATEQVKIPIDDTSEPPSVTIERTNRIVMRDTVTGELWTWEL